MLDFDWLHLQCFDTVSKCQKWHVFSKRTPFSNPQEEERILHSVNVIFTDHAVLQCSP